MKNFLISLIIHLFFVIYVSSNDINSNLSDLSIIKEKNNMNIEHKSNYLNRNKKRIIENDFDSFINIRIFIDKTYITQNFENPETMEKVMFSLEKCVKLIEELIKVKPSNKIKFNDTEIERLGFNNNEIDQNLLSTGEGISADLIIFPKFVEIQQKSQPVLAIGKPEIFDPISKRPIGAILSINKIIPSIPNSQSYLESVIIHQITHILGFIYEIFDKFEIGINKVITTHKEPRTNTTKKFIISPKVVEYAKKYFDCENITGVELEDLGGYDNYNHSHWEARILLGEYMNSEVHTPEQAISGFTLALLEDSGWYKSNLYTGGLMRFGKHQGCAFLYEDCEVNDNSKNKFKNDLFPISAINDLLRTTCSSGRQSRSYIITKNKISRGKKLAGKEIADDCFVSDYYKDEEDLSYYVGSCNKGNGEYGQMIYYNNEYSGKNGLIPENFGEKMTNNSFCVLSSAIPLSLREEDLNKFQIYDGIIHPMCYPMFCSSRSLTIQIYEQYIVCPREGGIVEIKGKYSGYIYCPDYNLICTGTIMCNDMFDCIEKHSLEKDNSFYYDYEIKTSQEKIEDENWSTNNLTIGYELSNEEIGKCPQFCSQCKENKKCFICKENYILIGFKEGDENPIYCIQNIDLGKYYKNENENTYYLCSDNCISCSTKDHCNNCEEMYKLKDDNSACEEIISNCKILDFEKDKCLECKENFYLLNDDKYHCYNNSLENDKYFTEDGGKIYISCNSVIKHCDKCEERNRCLKCNEGYVFNELNKTCVIEISSCKKYDSNYEYCEECQEKYYLLNDDNLHCYNESLDEDKYFTEDGGITYINCDKAIDNCEKCKERNRCLSCKKGYKYDNESNTCNEVISSCKRYDKNYEYCEECKEGYYLLDNDKLNCHNETLEPDKYFTEDEGKTYISCEKIIDNCEKCNGRNKCLLCQKGYHFYFGNSLCEEIISFCKKYDANYQFCEECNDKYYLLNSDRLHCHNETLSKDEYFTEDEGKTFISCESVIFNCEKCKERKECLSCKNGYIYNEKNITCIKAISSCEKYDTYYEYCEGCEKGFYLLNEDKLHCYNDTLDKDKYFTEDGGKTYISCENVIDNCEKCDGRKKCNQCQKNYEPSNSGDKCNYFEIDLNCKINIHYLEEEHLKFLEEENIQNLVEVYEKTFKYNLGQVEHYIDKKNNFTITIYITDKCTKDLLNIGEYSLNTTHIFNNYIEERLIICFITFNYKNYINFFENGKKIDIGKYYDQKVLKYNLENNFTNELNDYYSPLLIEKIMEKNIDIFSMENENLDNKCLSFEIGGIDVPIGIREKIFFNIQGKQEFICTDKNCEINRIDNQNSISNCNCYINNDIKYLLSENENHKINLDLFQSQIKFNIMDYIKCVIKNFDLKKLLKNFSFYLMIIGILIELFCFILFLSKKQIINFQKYLKTTSPVLSRQETQENKNILNIEELPKLKSSERIPMSNPPKKNLIKYKYKWLNKPKILNLDNSHDEDLEIQSRDEADIENELKRKIKIFPFNEENNSSSDNSYIDESLYETKDKMSEMSKNRRTIEIGEEKLQIKKNIIKIEPIQKNKNGALPQIVSREQNARKKVRVHSIKNTGQQPENNQNNKNIEEKVIKKPIEIYCDIIFIKQHLINLFSCPKKLEKESFIPNQMKIIRLIFLIFLNIFITSILLGQNYFVEKYLYFDEKYDFSHKAKKGFKISTNEKIKYSLNKCIISVLISFIICLIAQLIIGLLFFNTKEKIDKLIELDKIMPVKNDNAVLKKIKCLFILFFFINLLLIIVFCFFLLGFNIINNNSEIDFLIPSFVTFILQQIFPFIISIIITIIIYLGLKNNNKKMINFGKSLLY